MKTSEIVDLLQPWIGRIGDEELRGKVVETFGLALHRSGFKSQAAFLKMPFTLLADCKGVTFLEHTLAVTAGAVGLYQGQAAHYRSMPYAVDMDRLVAGSLLHDVGKILEIEPDGKGGYRKSRSGMCLRHPLSGLALAAEAGLPEEVLNCIGCHAKEGEGAPKTVETILIHQADFATFDPLVMLQKGTLVL
ncbi:MAG: HD domain-containing protein [Acidobacteriota bacterium]